VVNPALGISLGTLTGTFAAPTALTGGLSSTASGASGVNAVFTLNGVQLTRQSNAVSDAVDGVTFNLLKGGETGTTTLTVAQDTGAASAGMQTVITNYNTLMTTYKTASASTKNADGSINQAPLGGNQTASGIIAQIQAALTGTSAGLAGTSAYTNLSSLGVTTNTDGTLSLNSVTFKSALNKDPAAALRLLIFSGRSTNGAVTVNGGGPQTATGAVGFTINSFTPGGAVSGTFTTANGTITLTGTNGTLSGTGDLAGLSLSVTGIGSGTLTLSRGAGQATSDLITQDVAYGTGALSAALTNMTTQNNYLDLQIAQGQAMLAQRKTTLQNQFSQMEVAVAKLKASASSLIGA
jgi:flagellar hook-associated protein 2